MRPLDGDIDELFPETLRDPNLYPDQASGEESEVHGETDAGPETQPDPEPYGAASMKESGY